MAVHGAHLPHGEVAQRDRREPLRTGADRNGASDDAFELVTRQRLGNYLGAVQVISGAEQEVEQEQLPGDVGDVEHLRGGIQRHQIVAVAVADTKAKHIAGQKAAHGGTAAGTVALLVLEVVVEMSDHVLDGLLASLRVQRVLDRLSRLDEVVDVDTGTVVEQSPEQARHVKQQRLRAAHFPAVLP